ncbi:hypothetical protein SAMN06295912_102194 [Sphingomonas laterariae]|uniref:Phasin protein n=1 Tax=Edaphosphingomonas laterariae TaxID=861865 RepID=A0A239CIJ2_9SPHN|nr:hypothetical protein [Sphingomonas laterariae]SNS19153.1 hypothetical protein SAMN06295912_102194 [Sphingomonas laterariae]
MEPFTAWVDFQEEMLKLHRAQLDAAQKAFRAGAGAAAAQTAATKAAEAGLDMWKSWFRLWGIK